MKKLIVLRHVKGAPGLRLLGLGPHMRLCKGLTKLQDLFNKNGIFAFLFKNYYVKVIYLLLIISCIRLFSRIILN